LKPLAGAKLEPTEFFDTDGISKGNRTYLKLPILVCSFFLLFYLISMAWISSTDSNSDKLVNLNLHLAGIFVCNNADLRLY
jgi:hypothetical protein